MSYRYDSGATPMKSQQYGCLTYLLNDSNDHICQHGWGNFHKASHLDEGLQSMAIEKRIIFFSSKGEPLDMLSDTKQLALNMAILAMLNGDSVVCVCVYMCVVLVTFLLI